MVKCFHPAVGKMFYAVGTQCYMPALCFAKSGANIYIYIIIQIFFELFSKKTVSKRRTLSELNWSLMCPQKASKALCELLRPGKPASVSGIRYRRGPPTVPNMRAVLKKASWGTRRISGSIRCAKQAFTVRKRYSVPKTGSWGTRRIFKGPQNSRLHRLWTASCGTRRIFRGVPGQKQHLPQRQPLQCAKRPRSEVIRLKRG